MKQYLFIYGTLFPEFAPSEIAEMVNKLKFVSKGFVYGRLYDLGKYPAAILDNSAKTKIHGRVYEIPINPQVLKALDEYEEFHPQSPNTSLYLRTKTIVYLDDTKIQSWIYEYNRDISLNPVIESGVYSTFQPI